MAVDEAGWHTVQRRKKGHFDAHQLFSEMADLMSEFPPTYIGASCASELGQSSARHSASYSGVKFRGAADYRLPRGIYNVCHSSRDYSWSEREDAYCAEAVQDPHDSHAQERENWQSYPADEHYGWQCQHRATDSHTQGVNRWQNNRTYVRHSMHSDYRFHKHRQVPYNLPCSVSKNFSEIDQSKYGVYVRSQSYRRCYQYPESARNPGNYSFGSCGYRDDDGPSRRTLWRGYGRLPRNWLECPKYGSVILGMFLPFKTLLGHTFNDRVPAADRWNVQELLRQQASLGLVIDLTNTQRYYDPEELRISGCEYYKLSCVGHDEAPDRHQIRKFISTCQQFISRNPAKTIGVHCTHGCNRTGFLIAAYLVETRDISPGDAISLFAEARPPGIYKQFYVDDLCHRFKDRIPDQSAIPIVPPAPDWLDEDERRDIELSKIAKARQLARPSGKGPA